MLACIPLQPQILIRQQPLPSVKTHVLVPSSTTYPHKVVRVPQVVVQDRIPQVTDANVYHDPLGVAGPGIVYEKGRFDHFSYLDLVLKLIQYFADNGIPVCMPWLNEILRLEEKIRIYRANMFWTGENMDPDMTWAAEAWDFQIPEYNPDDIAVWSNIRGCWVSAI